MLYGSKVAVEVFKTVLPLDCVVIPFCTPRDGAVDVVVVDVDVIAANMLLVEVITALVAEMLAVFGVILREVK